MKYVQGIQEWKTTRIFNHLPNSCIKEVNFEKNYILQGRVFPRWAKVEEVLYLYQLLNLEQDMLKMSLLKRTFFFFFFLDWDNDQIFDKPVGKKVRFESQEIPLPQIILLHQSFAAK